MSALSESASTTADHIIDLDADPFVPDGWEVEEHQKSKALQWNAAQVELYLPRFQRSCYLDGHRLRKLLDGKPVLNANVLDYLFKNPQLIPNKWKRKSIFFWGTVYRAPFYGLCVRYLCWYGGGWRWSTRPLGLRWHGDGPAAVSAN